MVLKIVLCGDQGVGKSTLRHKYLGFGFKSQYMMTIGAEFSLKDVIWKEDHPLAGSSTKAQIWELAPQQRFKNSRPLYYMGSSAGILVYDVTRMKTFENLTTWLKEIHTQVGAIPIAVIGNKIDLRKASANEVTTQMGLEFAKLVKEEFLNNSCDVPFIETSAQTGEHLDALFNSLVEIIYSHYST